MKRLQVQTRQDFFYTNQEFIEIDPAPNTRRAAFELLSQQLVDALDLELQAKQAHWNLKGTNLFSLHELFDHVAETVAAFSDLLAERAVQIGGFVEGTVQIVARDSRLPVYVVDLNRGSDHLRALATALGRFAATVRMASSAATVAGDSDTADVFTHVSRAADLLLWKMSAHICEPWEKPDATSRAR